MIVGAAADHCLQGTGAGLWLIHFPEVSVVNHAPQEVDSNESQCSGVENTMWFILTERKVEGEKNNYKLKPHTHASANTSLSLSMWFSLSSSKEERAAFQNKI